LNVQDLAKTAWVLATAGQPDVQLFMALARMAQQRAGEINAQILANTA